METSLTITDLGVTVSKGAAFESAAHVTELSKVKPPKCEYLDREFLTILSWSSMAAPPELQKLTMEGVTHAVSTPTVNFFPIWLA